LNSSVATKSSSIGPKRFGSAISRAASMPIDWQSSHQRKSEHILY